MFQRFIMLALIVQAAAMSVAAYQEKADVTDASGEPLPYVTYRITPSGAEKPIISKTTDEAGALTATIATAGTYGLSLTYVGMAPLDTTFTVDATHPTVNLGRLALREAGEMLENITVTAQRPLVVKQIDRIGYDVQADPDAPTVTLNDILRKVPMVSVDPDGTIKVNGSTDFKIYKNGRPNNSMSRNAKDLFAALPASMIKRIEVITEPGAAYDAEGTTAILNIVTNEDTRMDGVLGNVNLRYATRAGAPPMASTWLTSEINKVTFNVYAGFNRWGGVQGRSEYEEMSNYPDGSAIHRTGRSQSRGGIVFYGLESSWQIDTLNLFTAEVSGYNFSYKNWSQSVRDIIDPAGNVTGGYTSTGLPRPTKSFSLDGNFNYQHNTHRKGETYTLSYMVTTSHDKSNDMTEYSDLRGTATLPYTATQSVNKQNFIEHTFQGDWTRPFGIHTLDFGAKGILCRNHSDGSNMYTGMTAEPIINEFQHNTDIAAIYGQYSVQLKKVMLRAGLRYEYSHLKASYPDGSEEDFSANLNDLVPTAAVSWQVNDANSLSFNYSTSIARPGINYLDPTVNMTPTTVSYGNPDLESATRRSMKLQYMLIKPKFNMQFAVNYGFNNSAIAPVNYLNGEGMIVNTYANVGHSRNLSFSGFVQWTVTPKTRLMLNAAATYNRFRQSGMSLERWNGRVYGTVNQELPFKVRAELFAYYTTGWCGNVYGYSKRPFNTCYYQLQLSRSFLKEDRLTVRAGVSQPIGPRKSVNRSYTVNGDVPGWDIYRSDNICQFSLSVSYRFGSLKASVRKVDRGINNDDMEGGNDHSGQGGGGR